MLAVSFSRQEPGGRSGTRYETTTLYHLRREKAIPQNGSRKPLVAGLEKNRAYRLEQVSFSRSRPTRLSVVATAPGYAGWDAYLPITPKARRYIRDYSPSRRFGGCFGQKSVERPDATSRFNRFANLREGRLSSNVHSMKTPRIRSEPRDVSVMGVWRG